MDYSKVLTELVTAHNFSGEEIPPVKIVDLDGDILEIKEIKFSVLNGGEIHIVAEDD